MRWLWAILLTACSSDIGPDMPRHRTFPPVFEADHSDTYVDDFAMRAHREITRRDATQGAQPVIPVETRGGAWSGYQQLGNEIAFAPDTNNRQTVLRLDEWGFPQVWTVMLAMDLPPGADSVGGFAVTAEVHPGAGGTVDSFLVDWNQGVTFSVVCNAITINAIYSNVVNIPSGLRLRAIIGRHTLFGAEPSVTIAGDSLALSSFQAQIPKYAKYVEVLRGSGAGGDVYAASTSYSFQSGPSSAGLAFLTGANLLAFGGRVGIPGGANFFSGGSIPDNLHFVYRFGLAL